METMLIISITIAVVTALASGLAYAEMRVARVQAREADRRALLYEEEARQHRDELRVVREKLEEARDKVVGGPFRDPEEAWPEDVKKALTKYPVELRVPTEQWIRDQRKFQVGWDLIRSRVMSGGGENL